MGFKRRQARTGRSSERQTRSRTSSDRQNDIIARDLGMVSTRAGDGTDFTDEERPVHRLYQRIYAVVRQIPPGTVATYGHVAELAGIPGGARVVGTALRVAETSLELPWHRVIGKRGPNRGGVSIHDPVGAAIQRGLLENDGVAFLSNGRIDLRCFGWQPLARDRHSR